MNKPTDVDIAELKISNLEYEIEQKSQLIARLHIAYLCMTEAHVNLLLSTMTRKSIVDLLEGAYAFDLPSDAHTDLRDALNAELAERVSQNKVSMIRSAA